MPHEYRPAAGKASASGVRRGGDSFQDLFVLAGGMRLLQKNSPFIALEVEAREAGNVDDVVLRTGNGDDSFAQVKWSTVQGALLDTKYLLAHSPNGTSLLQKLYASHQKLSPRAKLEWITNKAPDPNDALLGQIDGRTDMLVPYARDSLPRSNARKQLELWANHVGVSDQKLLELLDHLRFSTGRTISAEKERVRALMESVGLKSTQSSLSSALATVAEWVIEGRRKLTPEQVSAEVDRLELRATDARAVLLVQAIDRDPHPEDATETLDWVDLFDGPDPRSRVAPLLPESWTKMQSELEQAISRLESAASQDIILRGAMRQATFFAVGASAPRTREWNISYTQRRGNDATQLWSTASARKTVPAPSVSVSQCGNGPDLGIVISVAADATKAVLKYVNEQSITVDEVITIQPAEGAHDQSIEGAGEAVAFAQHIVDAARNAIEDRPAGTLVHLFLAGPGGLALLLGHRWNRISRTIVYEHLGTGMGYTPAFRIA